MRLLIVQSCGQPFVLIAGFVTDLAHGGGFRLWAVLKSDSLREHIRVPLIKRTIRVGWGSWAPTGVPLKVFAYSIIGRGRSHQCPQIFTTRRC